MRPKSVSKQNQCIRKLVDMQANKTQNPPKYADEVFRSLSHAARYAGVSRPTFTKHILPRVPHRHIGSRVLITKAALTKWLEQIDEENDKRD